MFGVVCFLDKYDELFMWFYYSNVGKGVCLIFDKEKLFNMNLDGYFWIECVEY